MSEQTITWNERGWANGLAGLVAGLVGGVVYGLLVPPTLGFGLNLVISGGLGVIFGFVFRGKIRSVGAGLVWGQAFGLLWWLFGELLLLPLVLGQGLPWTLAAAQARLPLLLGQVAAYGAVMGYSYAWLARRQGTRGRGQGIRNTQHAIPNTQHRPTAHTIIPHPVQVMIVGGLGGLLGSWVFVWGLVGTQFYEVVAGIVRSESVGAGRAVHYLIGLIIGASFGLLFDRNTKDPGDGTLYGISYGLLWWIIGPMLLLPWLLGRDARPYWTVATAQSLTPSLVGHILYGALVGFFYGVVNRLWHLLFVDSDPLNRSAEGAGVRGVRAMLMGQAGGMLGGLLFTMIMVGVGALPRVASLVGGDSVVVGLLVHLVISLIIGMSYGLLFQGITASYASALAIGLLYGWFWWVLGALTLFPILLRQPADWSLATILALNPSLIGHLLYGAALGLLFQYLERRYNAEVAGQMRRRALAGSLAPTSNPVMQGQSEGSAAALWVVTLVLGVVVPLLLWTGNATNGGGY